MDRRQMLRALGAASGAVLLPACSGGTDDEAAPFQAADAVPTLFVQTASFETLTGSDRILAFGVRTLDNDEVVDADLQAYVRRIPSGEDTGDGEVVLGPVEASYAPAETTGQGVYWLRADLPEPGAFEVVAVDGEDWGASAFQVRAPEESQLSVPGQEAVSAPTPTTANELGVFDVCTRDPECGMHEVSLDAALESGRPVVLLFATPQFCQTVVCGPAVDTVESVRTQGDHPDVVFIHSEIYAEDPGGNLAGAELTPAVEAWGLPTEPWLFTIAADGRIADRLDGPMPRPVVEAMVAALEA